MMIRTVLIGAALAILATGPASASTQTDVVASIQQWVDSFNQAEFALASCSAVEAMVDDIPPYEWHGKGACSAWAKAYTAWSTANSATNGSVTLGKFHHIEVKGPSAYVVLAVSYSATIKDKPHKMQGIVTAALKKTETGWSIIGWTWTDQ